eukprot:COSAG01_NODE_5455_length_4255_cov_2.391963_3_plen_148_part_00
MHRSRLSGRAAEKSGCTDTLCTPLPAVPEGRYPHHSTCLRPAVAVAVAVVVAVAVAVVVGPARSSPKWAGVRVKELLSPITSAWAQRMEGGAPSTSEYVVMMGCTFWTCGTGAPSSAKEASMALAGAEGCSSRPSSRQAILMSEALE